MSTNSQTIRVLRRLIACANASIANIRQIADAIGPQTTAATALLDIADLLDSASLDAVSVLTYGPTPGDAMMIREICRKVDQIQQHEETGRVH